jgi:hypothetical protein
LVNDVGFWLASFGRAALILGLALCIGYPVCRRILRGPAAPVLSLMVGMAFFGLIVCLLSWLRIFGGVSVTIVGVAAAGVSLRYLRQDLPGWRRRLRATWPPSIPVIAAFTLLGAALIAYSALSLYPVTAFDATSYHLPLARDLVANHGLAYDPFARYSFFPQANESMFAVMLLMSKTSSAPAALEFGMLAVAVLALPLWFLGSGRSIAGGLVAGLIVLASPVVILAGTVPYVDVWTMDFVLGALLIGLEAAEGRVALLPGLTLSGLLLGEAAATKYLAIGFAIAAAIGILVAAGRSRISWRSLAAGTGAFLLIALPWYAWTIHTTGDPLYPFATGVFGNRPGLWTAFELKFQTLNEMPNLLSGLHGDVEYLLGNWQADTGTGWSPLSWWVGVGFLGLLVPSLRRSRTFLAATLAGALSLALAVVLSTNFRYWVTAIAPLSISAGLFTEWAFGAIRGAVPARLRDLRLAPVWCVAAAVAFLFSSAKWEHGALRARGPLPTTSSKMADYLRPKVPCYGAVEYLNEHAGPRYRAWAFACEQDRYFASGRLISDVFSTGSRSRIYDAHGFTMPSDQTLWQRLQPLHVAWMILPATNLPRPAVLDAHGLFEYMTTVGAEDVFRVRGA